MPDPYLAGALALLAWLSGEGASQLRLLYSSIYALLETMSFADWMGGVNVELACAAALPFDSMASSAESIGSGVDSSSAKSASPAPDFFRFRPLPFPFALTASPAYSAKTECEHADRLYR